MSAVRKMCQSERSEDSQVSSRLQHSVVSASRDASFVGKTRPSGRHALRVRPQRCALTLTGLVTFFATQGGIPTVACAVWSR